MLKALITLFKLELAIHLRRSSAWLYPLGFFLIVIILFPLAITQATALLTPMMPGCFWIAALLASLLGVESIFFSDLEDHHADLLFLSHIHLFLMILTKLIDLWLVTGLPLVLMTPLLGWLFQLNAATIMMLMLTLLLGTPILTFIGALGAALTLSTKQQSMLLGVLMLPLSLPVLIFGVTIVREHSAQMAVAGALAFFAALLLLTLLTIPFAIAAAVKIHLDD